MAYDLIVCGTGFASTFFLREALQLKPSLRVLVLERGYDKVYDDQLRDGRVSDVNSEELIDRTGDPDKKWLFTVALGGGSNCWWGQTPRLQPDDFKIKTLYGVGSDWPISYDDLSEYYTEVEELMQISGGMTMSGLGSVAYPQPAHPLSTFDIEMQRLYGEELWVASPTARSSLGTQRRGKCCANGVCGLCPVDAKFRIMNEFSDVFSHPNVTLKLGATVKALEITGGAVSGVVYTTGGKTVSDACDLVFLGTNAIFNAQILLKSGDDNKFTGKNLHEQVSTSLSVDLGSIASFDGGTHISGLGYMFYSGPERSNYSACLIENHNAPPRLRTQNGKWRNRAVLKVVAENIPEATNFVSDQDRPQVHFAKHSEYALGALDRVVKKLVSEIDRSVGVEDVVVDGIAASEGHIQGTTRMSVSDSEGVVDHRLVHHRYRNVIVGGAGAFPSGPPANPSLTISALSVRSARAIFGSAG